MNNASINKVLEDLHEATAKDLLRRVQSGEASPAELVAALRMLKDNGIEAMPTQENPLGELAKQLPQFSEQEELH